jgi:hypothetical protein
MYFSHMQLRPGMTCSDGDCDPPDQEHIPDEAATSIEAGLELDVQEIPPCRSAHPGRS